MERGHVGVPMAPARVGIGAVVEQPLHGRRVIPLGHQVQRAAARAVGLGSARGSRARAARPSPSLPSARAAIRSMTPPRGRRSPRAALVSSAEVRAANGFHHAPVDTGRGRIGGRRKARTIHCQRVRTQIHQQRHHLRTIHPHGEVQRELMVLVAAHPAVQHRRRPRHDPADLVRQVQRDRREDVVLRAATEEKVATARWRRRRTRPSRSPSRSRQGRDRRRARRRRLPRRRGAGRRPGGRLPRPSASPYVLSPFSQRVDVQAAS